MTSRIPHSVSCASAAALALLAFSFAQLPTSAQTPAPPVTPASATPPPRPAPLVSPEVKDGKITFRFAAPKAQEVKLNVTGIKEARAMQKDEKGVWSVTLEGLEPDIYQYQFNVDGIATIDPANHWIAAGLRPSRSMVELPGNPPALWETQDVPHGIVSMHTFQSKSLGKPRTFRVYTPPGYDQQPSARFPVLYLLHGSGDMDDGWTIIGRAHLIEDNLLAAGKAKPMLIVMPDGGYPRGVFQHDDFEKDLFEAIIPLVEAHYRVAPGAANHAMAGLSMGGFQTLNIGVKHEDEIAWLGVFSAGIRDDYNETHGEYLRHANEKLSLFWIGIGEDDFLLAGEKKLEALLKETGVKYEAHISKGGHVWSNWRHYLDDFLPLLFQTKS